jgi:glycosyltransferase involved in cell wall biosynthesis
MNVVNIHIINHCYHTGVDRYLDMFRQGIAANREYDCLRIHSIYLTDDPKTIFLQINPNEKGEISAVIPLPRNSKLLFTDVFWKNKYINVVISIIKPYLKDIDNPVFHCHNLFLSNFALALRAEFGGKTVLHLHCLPWKFFSDNNDQLFNRLYQLYENGDYTTFKNKEGSKVNYGEHDRIICLSKSSKNYLVNIHAIDDKKIHTVLNGLVRNETARMNGENIEILYAGKVSRDKGIFELLNAVNAVNRKGYALKLKIAGSYLTETMLSIRGKYPDIDVEFLGQIKYGELVNLYATCTMGIIPSLHEQCSYVALEMAMFGVPMIVSDVDALGEMFEDGKTALLVPMRFDPDFGLSADTEKFADNIVRLIADGDLRESLSRNVRNLYGEKFTLEKMMEQTVKIYRELW